MIVALAGGVGSARFLAGLLEVVDPSDVVIVGNTGDDDWFHGLRRVPRPRLGHLHAGRRQQPRDGLGPRRARPSPPSARSSATACPPGSASATATSPPTCSAPSACGRARRCRRSPPRSPRAWGLDVRAAADDRRRGRPPSSPRRRPTGRSSFALEEWFVRERCEPPVLVVRYDGAEPARPAPGVLDAIAAARRGRHLPRQPDPVDRADPRGARDPRRGRRASARRRREQPHRGRRGEGAGRPDARRPRDRGVVRRRRRGLPRPRATRS